MCIRDSARRRCRPRVLPARVRLRARRAETTPARGTRASVRSGRHTSLPRYAASARSRLRRMNERGVAAASRNVRCRAAGEPHGSASRSQWNGAADHSGRCELRRRWAHNVGASPVLEVMHRKPSHAVRDTRVLIGISDIYTGNIHGAVDVSLSLIHIYLLFLLVAQDIAHIDGGYRPRVEINVLNAAYRWPVFR